MKLMWTNIKLFTSLVGVSSFPFCYYYKHLPQQSMLSSDICVMLNFNIAPH